MKNLDAWRGERKSEERDWKNEGKYPIIWKRTHCKQGDCLGHLTQHRWSVPCGTAVGLMIECFDCHLTRIIKTNTESDAWINHGTGQEWIKERLAVLK